MPERENTKNLFLETLDWICAKLEALRISYMITGGSERQIVDCESIWKINQESIDKGYIKQWVDILGIRNEFNKLALI